MEYTSDRWVKHVQLQYVFVLHGIYIAFAVAVVVHKSARGYFYLQCKYTGMSYRMGME